MTTKTRLTRGWGWPIDARMQHFFDDGPSLCHRWTSCPGTLTQEQVIGPRACPDCERKHPTP